MQTSMVNESSAGEHLITLPGEQWGLWKCVGLRGAGFPVTGVLALAASECARIADRLAAAEEEAERTWEAALEALSRELDEAEPVRRGALVRAIRQVKKGKPPLGLEPCKAEREVEEFAGACAAVDAISQEFHRTFASAMAMASESLKQIVRQPAFREAVTWQNRKALHTGMDALLESPASTTSQRSGRQRKREGLVASYWQRYCTKNDTIGFFGPVGWARLDSGAEALSVRPGPGLLARRTVYFEGWGIDALAEHLAADPSLRRWIAPRRSPLIRLEAATLCLADGTTTQLSADEAALLTLCDGNRTAGEIAKQLLGGKTAGLKTADEVYRLLESFSESRVVSWSFHVPLAKDPERRLREMVERIDDEALRAGALDVLARFESAFDRVAASAGDAEKLDRALEELERLFTGVTGAAATKDDGQTYAGRTLVWEDCVRDVEVEIGPELLQSLTEPLLVLLTSARWLVAEIVTEYRKALEQIYRELARQTGCPRVPGPLFWARAQALLFGSNRGKIDRCIERFQQRWAGVLSVPEAERRVHYRSAAIRSRVQAAFAVGVAQRSCFRYHSPDILVAAPDAEAVCKGDYQLVMGELHLGMNTLGQSLFVNQHPRPHELLRAIERDSTEARLVPVPPKFLRKAASRGQLLKPSARDFYLELAPDSPSPSTRQTLAIADLIVEDRNGVVVCSRDGRLQFDLIPAFAEALTGLIMNCFKVLPAARHSPRICIDRLVVCRESWAFSPADLDFAFETDEAYRFAAARRWARDLALPRFLYFKSPVEVKPCFLDLDSPTYVNLFAKVIRRTQEAGAAAGGSAALISLTEMLPTPEQAWLTDAQGNRYTSEFRVVALDLGA